MQNRLRLFGYVMKAFKDVTNIQNNRKTTERQPKANRKTTEGEPRDNQKKEREIEREIEKEIEIEMERRSVRAAEREKEREPAGAKKEKRKRRGGRMHKNVPACVDFEKTVAFPVGTCYNGNRGRERKGRKPRLIGETVSGEKRSAA